MSAPIAPDVKRKYVGLREQGHTRAEAARRCKVSYDWAKAFDRGLKNGRDGSRRYDSGPGSNPFIAIGAQEMEAAQPKTRGELCTEALRSLDDIGYFALRYFGLVLQPFQVWLTEQIVALAATPDKEFVVINQPPGTGKSTFYALVLPAWLTCRDRTSRGMILSATDTQAKWYVGNLRATLTAPHPFSAADDDKAAGIAFDAEATLVGDFGVFKPDTRDVKWASDAFFVELPPGITSLHKEPTWSAFGRSSGFLGLRVDYGLADDIYDLDKMRTADARDDLEKWWKNVAEKRLEPGGILILQMQRLDPDDICRRVLDMEGPIVTEEGAAGRKYHYFKFKAHYEELCHGDHGPDAAPYNPANPEQGGCLLYPGRISWADVESERTNNPNFEMVFQQEDVAAAKSLVSRLWINGGMDPETREIFPGCQDRERDLGEIPKGLDGLCISVATADPSPTNYWAIEWWYIRIDPVLNEPVERYLIDLHREKMEAPDLLDWNAERQVHVGIMEEWQTRSKAAGAPITHWIVEQNAAQRFLLQFEHANRWQRKHSVVLLGHETHRNKADPKMGVWSIRDHYKYGRIRLPYRWDTTARITSNKLVDEAIRYPGGRTDDCVMANWFMEWWLPNLVADTLAAAAPPPPQWRPWNDNPAPWSNLMKSA